MTKFSFLLLVMSILYAEVFAQKIKYKDIFPTLEAKNYDQGEPLLRQFFSNVKNADEPNANLQMAYILEQKALSARVIEDSTILYQNADSAILFFQKCKTLIDDKELKKNDDYYREFYRRDLRTGEFGIKLSDIQLAIDDKTAALRKRMTNAHAINDNVALIDRTYSASQKLFTDLMVEYNDYNDFVMEATSENLKAFDPLMDNDEIIEEAAKAITDAVIVIDNTGFNPELKKKPIIDLETDGKSTSDVFAGEFDFWDYKAWALKSKREVGTEILPIKGKIKQKDDEIAVLLTTTASGGSVTVDDIESALNLGRLQGIKKYDPKSFGLQLLAFRGQEVKYNYLSNPVYDPILVDSLAITPQLKRADTLLQVAEEQGQLLEGLVEANNMGAERKYAELLQTFGGEEGILTYLSNSLAVNRERITAMTLAKDYWTERARWGLLLGDSLDLTLDFRAQPLDSLMDKYIPIAQEVDEELNIYSVGVTRASDKSSGYVAMLKDSRLGEWVQPFTLHSEAYTVGRPDLKANFIPSAEGIYTFYVFDPAIDAADNFTIVNFDPTGKINWQLNTQLINEPVLTRFNEMLGETVLFMVQEDQLATLSSDKVGYIVIDRNGKVR